jgi:hypothetical protein
LLFFRDAKAHQGSGAWLLQDDPRAAGNHNLELRKHTILRLRA